ncbi:MAG: MaoC family dehydratase [Gammaproteobacteria bacterium]|nr:MaoC family dehydratase [Gammaproteobacteria bacterium]
MSQQAVLDDLTPKIGTEIFVGNWTRIDQDRINRFADATGDHQWIHVDAERAAKESPYGTTIAHGYLTLSLYPMLRELLDPDKPLYPGVKNVINYGLNKARFPAAVRVDSRLRARVELVRVDEVKSGLQITERFTAEIEGVEKPACVAEAVMRFYF